MSFNVDPYFNGLIDIQLPFLIFPFDKEFKGDNHSQSGSLAKNPIDGNNSISDHFKRDPDQYQIEFPLNTSLLTLDGISQVGAYLGLGSAITRVQEASFDALGSTAYDLLLNGLKRTYIKLKIEYLQNFYNKQRALAYIKGIASIKQPLYITNLTIDDKFGTDRISVQMTLSKVEIVGDLSLSGLGKLLKQGGGFF